MIAVWEKSHRFDVRALPLADCYRKAGFKHIGFTKVSKLYVMQLLSSEMPSPEEYG